MSQNWIEVAKVTDFPQDGGMCIKVGDEQIAVFNFTRRGEWYATQNLCPHRQQMAIGRGMIGSHGTDNEPKVACPFHKNTFSLIDGRGLSNEELSIKTYPIKVDGDAVFVCSTPHEVAVTTMP